jgi:hypothetical protein
MGKNFPHLAVFLKVKFADNPFWDNSTEFPVVYTWSYVSIEKSEKS